MAERRKTPASARILNQWVDSYAREQSHSPARMRNWVSYMVLGGALARAGFTGAGPVFTIKGGVALELRLRHLARATKDLDLILNAPDADPLEALRSALETGYEGFSFQVKGDPELMPNGALRVEVGLRYLGKGWGTVQVDVARVEGSGAEVEMVDAISLSPFGIQGPEALPCLSLPYHIAQKIHALTLPPSPGRRNERFRDLIDLLLIRDWVTDYPVVLKACQDVFASRGTHPWPPFVEPLEHWVEPFNQMAADVGLQTRDLHQAVIDVRRLVAQIDESAKWVAHLPAIKGLRATTWFFIWRADGLLQRVPAKVGEAFFTGGDKNEVPIPSDWQCDPGGLALIGVVLYLQDRKPKYVEGV